MGRTERTVLVIDTNLLVLLVVGSTSRHLVARHKKTKSFVVDDFDLLLAYIGERPLLILPNVAAETSNLVCFHDEPERHDLLATFRSLLNVISERYVSSIDAAMQREFDYLGLTDAAILEADLDAEILTTDALLYAAALRRGQKAINFNHLRDELII